MGSTVAGIYVPDVLETGWGTSVSNDLRRLADLVFNVKAFGAKCDGTTNDTTANQAALDAIPAGATLLFPAGTCLTDPLTITKPVILAGVGRGATTLKGSASVAGSGVFVKTSTSDVVGISIRDMTIDTNNVATASGVVFEYVSDLTVQRVSFKNGDSKFLRVGVSSAVDSVIRNHRILVDDCTFNTFTNTKEAVLIFNSEDVTIRKCYFYNSSTAIGIGFYQLVERALVDDCTFQEVKIGSYYSLSCNKIVYRKCVFFGSTNPTAGIRGANTSDNGAFGATVCTDIGVEDCFFYLNVDDPVPCRIGAVERGWVRNCDFYRNNGLGLEIDTGVSPTSAPCSGIEVAGCSFIENNQQNNFPRLHSGIYINGTHADFDLDIHDCLFDDNQGTQTQANPITFDGGAAFTNVQIHDNKVGYAGSDGFLELANSSTFSTNVYIHDNVGYNPQGIAAITVTASPFTYTAGPTPEAVYIFGGTVSQVAKNSVNLFTATGCTVVLGPGEAVVVTYSSAPTMKKDRK